MARSNEPFFWAPFSAGMMIGAMVLPALIFITGIAWSGLRDTPPGADAAQALVNNMLTRLFLVVVISLSLMHWAHRFRFTLVDAFHGLKEKSNAIASACYGTALVLSLVAVAIGLKWI